MSELIAILGTESPASAPGPRPRATATHIYFVESGEGGPIKIGTVAEGFMVHVRIASLQTGNPEPLRLLAVRPGDRSDEQELHREFRADHIRGEWFRRSERLLRLIRESQ